MSTFTPTPSRHNTPSARQPPSTLSSDLLAADFVLVRRDGHVTPLTPLYDGPYRVLRRSPHYFQLQIGLATDNVSVHRLKAAVMPPDAQATLPPCRSRPPHPPPPVLPVPLPPSQPSRPLRSRHVTFATRPTVILIPPSAPPPPLPPSASPSSPVPPPTPACTAPSPLLRPSGLPVRQLRPPAHLSLYSRD